MANLTESESKNARAILTRIRMTIVSCMPFETEKSKITKYPKTNVELAICKSASIVSKVMLKQFCLPLYSMTAVLR